MTDSSEPEKFERLRELVAAFPTGPGVYFMRDAGNQVIYVGKAKDLRARVRNYLGAGDGRYQISFLMKRVQTIDKIVVETEDQAFVLERDLITKYKPRYNIRLKDDKSYLSIRIDDNAEWPKLELVRRVEQDGARYYGPYTFSYELRSILEVIKRTVPLRTCSDAVLYNRQRPCLEYQIKRCAAPCVLAVDREQYRDWIQQAVSILEGNTGSLIGELTERMEQASVALRFEEAAVLRDRITVLERFERGHNFITHNFENRDIFAIHREGSCAALCILHVRGGRVLDATQFSFSEVAISDEEIVEAGLSQFYDGGREVPGEILLPFELSQAHMVKEALERKRDGEVTLSVPEQGSRARLLTMAQLNAQQYFADQFDAESRYLETAKELQKRLGLRTAPRKIECMDISNFQGSNIVGAVVSFFDGEPQKSAYRRYKISMQGKPDDFASMNEVVRRRLERGKREDDLPDLLVIDGGQGQLGAACTARDEAGVDLEIISIAKMRTVSGKRQEIERKPERIFKEHQEVPILLAPGDTVTNLLERIRDEVHRFVITFHRAQRSKRVFESALDRIPGIGAERKRRLLRAFGSVKNMRDIDIDELAKAGRMPRSLAERMRAEIRGERDAEGGITE